MYPNPTNETKGLDVFIFFFRHYYYRILLLLLTVLLYCIVLYASLPVLIVYHNPMRQNPLASFVQILTPIKPMYLPLPIPFLSLTHAVTNNSRLRELRIDYLIEDG